MQTGYGVLPWDTQRRWEEKICSTRPWRPGLESTFSPLLLFANDWAALLLGLIERERDWLKSSCRAVGEFIHDKCVSFCRWRRGKQTRVFWPDESFSVRCYPPLREEWRFHFRSCLCEVKQTPNRNSNPTTHCEIRMLYLQTPVI